MNKKKTVILIILAILLLPMIAVLCFCQFTKVGYLMSIPYRPGFQLIEPNVYMNKGNSLSPEEAKNMTEQARSRVRGFFGEMRCEDSTILIISDDESISGKIGEKETISLLVPRKRDYICLSNDYFNVDVVAHEFTHAEFHSHLSAEAQRSIPIWFDEGLATQNDHREKYSYENWVTKTDSGRNATPLEDMDTVSEFQCSDEDERQYHYLCAKYEVREWINTHSVQQLIELAERVNEGEDFHTLYGK